MLRVAFTALILASSAQAQSCREAPTLSDSFRFAAGSDRAYVLAAGIVDRLGGQQSTARTDLRGVPQSFEAKARFTGVRAGAGGLNQRFNEIITVEVSCAGLRCGAVPQGGFIAFLERRGDTHVLRSGPCPDYALHRDSPAARAEVRACLAGQCPR